MKTLLTPTIPNLTMDKFTSTAYQYLLDWNEELTAAWALNGQLNSILKGLGNRAKAWMLLHREKLMEQPPKSVWENSAAKIQWLTGIQMQADETTMEDLTLKLQQLYPPEQAAAATDDLPF